MIIVKLMGGLGNQMFQYAAAKSIALKNETNLFLVTSFLEDNYKKDNYQFFQLKLILKKHWARCHRVQTNKFA